MYEKFPSPNYVQMWMARMEHITSPPVRTINFKYWCDCETQEHRENWYVQEVKQGVRVGHVLRALDRARKELPCDGNNFGINGMLCRRSVKRVVHEPEEEEEALDHDESWYGEPEMKSQAGLSATSRGRVSRLTRKLRLVVCRLPRLDG